MLHDLAETLSILCDDETLAALIDCTLSAECDERLNDRKAELAGGLFDSLCELRPELIEMAQNRDWRWRDTQRKA